MALKPDRDLARTDVSFFMNEVAERGGVAVLSTGGSGAAMDQSAALVTYAAEPSGKMPLGIVLGDMVNYDLTKRHLDDYKYETQKGGKMALLKQGYVVTNNIEGSTTSLAGKPAYIAHSGNVAQSNIVADDTGGQIVGTFLSNVDEDGYAKVEVNLPRTTA
jgi:thiamine pyrophosphokinase